MLGFKEILWDSGGVWLLLLAMTIGFAFQQLNYFMSLRKQK
jgi:hypothetical protein